MSKHRPKAVCGIDAGLKGGIVAVSLRGKLLCKERMPIREDARAKKTIDCAAMWLALARVAAACEPVLCVTEHQHSFGTEARSRLWRFALGVGRMQATVELCWPGVPFMDVDPQCWKTSVLGDRSATKEATVAWAREKHPEDGLSTHDGIADAIGQAWYGIKWLKARSKETT